MSKQRITLCLESDVYLAAKASGLNLSETATKLFREFLQTQECTREEATLMRERDEKQQLISNLMEEVSHLSILIVQSRDKRDEENQKKLDAALKMSEAVSTVNPMKNE